MISANLNKLLLGRSDGKLNWFLYGRKGRPVSFHGSDSNLGSDYIAIFLKQELREGNVFTGVCQFVHGRGVGLYPSMGIPPPMAVTLKEIPP